MIMVRNWGRLYPQETVDNVWGHFPLSQLGGGVLLAYGGWRPGMQLHTPQCTGRPTSEGHPATNVSGLRLRNQVWKMQSSKRTEFLMQKHCWGTAPQSSRLPHRTIAETASGSQKLTLASPRPPGKVCSWVPEAHGHVSRSRVLVGP